MNSSAAAAALDRSQRLWPKVSLRCDDLLEHARRLNVSDSSMQEHGHELCLALASAHGDRHAIEHLTALVEDARPALYRLRASSDFADDVLQSLRERLLVGAKARISCYAAKGSLAGWLRRTALNIGLTLLSREPPVVAQPSIGSVMDVDPYADSTRWIAQQALDAVLAQLNENSRLLLNFHLQGLSIDRLDPSFGSHRATRARRLAALKAQIRSAVVERFRARVGVSKREAEQTLQGLSCDLAVGAWLTQAGACAPSAGL